MKIPAERTIRRWRSNLRTGKAFKIAHEGLAIFIDGGGYATRLTESGKYDEPVGRGAKIVDMLEKGEQPTEVSPVIPGVDIGSEEEEPKEKAVRVPKARAPRQIRGIRYTYDPETMRVTVLE